MKIAIVVRMHWPALGGSEVFQHIVASSLAEKHEVKVLTQFKDIHEFTGIEQAIGGGAFPPYRDGKAEVRPIPISGLERAILSPFRLYETMYYDTPLISRYPQLIKEVYSRLFSLVYAPKIASLIRGADVVHTFNGEFLGWATLGAARRLGIPFVIAPLAHPGRWLDDEFNLKLYRQADAVIANLEYDHRFYIESGVDERRVHAIGNVFELSECYDAEEFRRRHGLEGHKIVLFIGAKRRYKGYHALLEAATSVWQEFPEARFVFIGPGAGPKTEGVADAFAAYADARIMDLGVVSLEEKTSALAACDIFCLPSVSESFGIVFLEAWALGKPVIASDIPQSRELVCHGRDGLNVEQTPATIATAITCLLKDDGLRQRMGEAGRQKVQQKYMRDMVVGNIEAIYEQVVRGR